MSPEQIKRDPQISFGSDIYSLGSVLYEVLTGRTPFDGEQTYEILDLVQNQQPAKPSAVSKYPVPRVLEQLCLRCLQKEPAARPLSMKEVVRTLEQDWASDLLRTGRRPRKE
jgi:serine/threonine protein kinase